MARRPREPFHRTRRPSPRSRLANGIVAGAVATLARELVSSLDVAIRGRPMSETHQRTVGRLADLADVSLGPAEPAANRRAGLGPLLGFANGVLAVTLFVALTGRRRPPTPVAGVLVGVGALIIADGPMAALGATNPRRWQAQDWFEDAFPYVAYSIAAMATLRRLERATGG
ncbi:hypothetical protein ACI2K4_01760 [Micromonospora sp. NPDC050397]|uniref:hypothetical protein n=1 Tax=Micromonospora sp. NPDC050397 TaxID=3364279 RepID=UPI00384DD31C